MLGQSVYRKTQSKELLTTLNRIGVSTSYNDARRSRNLLASFTIQKSVDETPIASHFNNSAFVISAIDNSDNNDNSSLSGKNSRHYTATVLFQAQVYQSHSDHQQKSFPAKSCLVITNLPFVLLCHLTSKLKENVNIKDLDTKHVIAMFGKVEFLISFVLSGLHILLLFLEKYHLGAAPMPSFLQLKLP